MLRSAGLAGEDGLVRLKIDQAPRAGDRRMIRGRLRKEVWGAVHTKKDAGRLGNRILREAGVE